MIQRGNNRVPTFVTPRDFAVYRGILGDASRRAGCAIHAYALMTNHTHLLVTPEDERGLARMMQILGRRYVRHFNALQARTGTLWEGRFRSALIDTERYFFACSRYIELNPVRAGLSPEPSGYRWSSFHRNARGVSDDVVTPHALYMALATTATLRQEAYRGLFAAALDTEIIEDIRRATNANTTIGVTTNRAKLAAQIERRLAAAKGL